MERNEPQAKEEKVFLPTIDYNMAIWMAYQNCINVIIFARHENDFTNAVTILSSMILPDWQDAKYKAEIKKQTDPRVFFRAITNLLHRRQFFEKAEREDLVG